MSFWEECHNNWECEWWQTSFSVSSVLCLWLSHHSQNNCDEYCVFLQSLALAPDGHVVKCSVLAQKCVWCTSCDNTFWQTELMKKRGSIRLNAFKSGKWLTYNPNNMQVLMVRFKDYFVVSSLWQHIVYHHFPRLMPGCLAFHLTCQCSATNYASSTLFTSHLKRLDSKCKAVCGAVILSSAVYGVYEWWLLTGLVRIIPETEIKMLVRSHGSII